MSEEESNYEKAMRLASATTGPAKVAELTYAVTQIESRLAALEGTTEALKMTTTELKEDVQGITGSIVNTNYRVQKLEPADQPPEPDVKWVALILNRYGGYDTFGTYVYDSLNDAQEYEGDELDVAGYAPIDLSQIVRADDT